MNNNQQDIINFKERLKQSKFYPDLKHSADPELVLLVGSVLYGFNNQDSDFDIDVFVNPETLKWPYGHCWQEFLIYQGRKVEWYYLPSNILSLLDNPASFDKNKYSVSLAGIIAIGMLWSITDFNIIEVCNDKGKEFLNQLKDPEIKQKLLNLSLYLLFNGVFKNKIIKDIENFYIWLSPKHLYRILVLFYHYLNKQVDEKLIWALKNEDGYEQYISDIVDIYAAVKNKFNAKSE